MTIATVDKISVTVTYLTIIILITTFESTMNITMAYILSKILTLQINPSCQPECFTIFFTYPFCLTLSSDFTDLVIPLT